MRPATPSSVGPTPPTPPPRPPSRPKLPPGKPSVGDVSGVDILTSDMFETQLGLGPVFSSLVVHS